MNTPPETSSSKARLSRAVLMLRLVINGVLIGLLLMAYWKTGIAQVYSLGFAESAQNGQEVPVTEMIHMHAMATPYIVNAAGLVIVMFVFEIIISVRGRS